MNKEMVLPYYVADIIERLNDAGYLAFAVGGAVRDSFLGAAPSDWDVATSARPHEIKSVFPRTADTGIKYGTVTVLYGDNKAEVTTFRVESGYEDLRRPSQVGFSDSIIRDLERRDFTVNAIAYHPRLGIIDPMGGIADIQSRLIRTVGHADKRFGEDALRILRAYRFKAQLGFDIEYETHAAARALSHLLRGISRERIWQELRKTLLSQNPDVVFEMSADLEDYSVKKLKYCGFSLGLLPGVIYARLSGALYKYYVDGGDPNTAMRELKMDNDTLSKTAGILSASTADLPADRLQLKQQMSKYSAEITRLGIMLKSISSGCDYSYLLSEIDNILSRKECYLISDLDISGIDLIQLGFEGAEIGKALSYLLDFVMKDPSLNSKPLLLSLIKRRCDK